MIFAMTTQVWPRHTCRPLENGGFWIEGVLELPPEGLTRPMVLGQNWLLEMIRTQSGHTRGFYWAPFAIVLELPEIEDMQNGYFVGFSAPAAPPAPWLVTSMMFEMGKAELARAPQDFLPWIAEPRPYVALESTAVSPLSQRAKLLIADNFTTSIPICEVARVLGVSHAHLTRQFKTDFGLTPADYRRRIRVNEAVRRLSRGHEILETGYGVGFGDTSRFYKNFRKATGTSPGKCRP